MKTMLGTLAKKIDSSRRKYTPPFVFEKGGTAKSIVCEEKSLLSFAGENIVAKKEIIYVINAKEL